MPTLGTALLPAPSDWNEFEDICADLFGREWGDPNVTRYARQGERQDGVDIYGTLNRKPAGVQSDSEPSSGPDEPMTIERLIYLPGKGAPRTNNCAP
jgi:hypothetical protein